MRQVLLSVFLLIAPLRLGADTEALGLALDALSQGDMALATQAAARIDDPIARDIITWTRLRAAPGAGDWREYRDFLARNPDWPGLPFLRTQGEAAIPENASPGDVIAYFASDLPTTGAGSRALALAHQARGDRAAAKAEAIRGWTSLVMTGAEAGQLRAPLVRCSTKAIIISRGSITFCGRVPKNARARCCPWCPRIGNAWPRRAWRCAHGKPALMR